MQAILGRAELQLKTPLEFLTSDAVPLSIESRAYIICLPQPFQACFCLYWVALSPP